MVALTRWGGIWGQLPMTTGRMFFVAPADGYTVDGQSYRASDGNDGLSPEAALRTIAQGVTNATASVGDTIILLEGTHTITATLALSKAGVSIIGVPFSPLNGRYNRYRPKAIIASTGTDIETINITAANVELGYVGLVPTTARSAVVFQTTTATAGFYCHDCYFDLNTPAIELRTEGIDFANRTATGDGQADTSNEWTRCFVENCVFDSDGAQGPAVHVATAGVNILNCHFMNTAGTWASPLVFATGSDNCYVDNSVWTTSGTMSLCIGGHFATAADGVHVYRCFFPESVGSAGNSISGFEAGQCVIAENYEAGIGAADGGVLVTAIVG